MSPEAIQKILGDNTSLKGENESLKSENTRLKDELSYLRRLGCRRAGERLADELQSSITEDERKFLLSMKMGEPEWGLLGTGPFEHLPSIQWKLENIRRMGMDKHKNEVEKLKRCSEGVKQYLIRTNI